MPRMTRPVSLIQLLSKASLRKKPMPNTTAIPPMMANQFLPSRNSQSMPDDAAGCAAAATCATGAGSSRATWGMTAAGDCFPRLGCGGFGCRGRAAEPGDSSRTRSSSWVRRQRRSLRTTVASASCLRTDASSSRMSCLSWSGLSANGCSCCEGGVYNHPLPLTLTLSPGERGTSPTPVEPYQGGRELGRLKLSMTIEAGVGSEDFGDED